MRSLFFAVVVIGVTTRAAHADDNVARADALFAQGKELEATDLHAACAKYTAAYELNSHAIGVLLNVARCDEKLGHVASAVAKYALARDMSIEQQMAPQLAAANERLGELAPRVPYVAITFSAPPPAGTSILIDDKQVVSLDALTDIAIDPGEHKVSVSAPSFLTFTATFAIAEGEKRTVVIGALERAVSSGSSRRTMGLVTGSVGVAAGLTGLVVGLLARSNYNDAVAECNDMGACPAGAFSDINRARSLGNVGTVLGISGAVVAGVGVYLFLSAPSPQRTERAVSIIPTVDDHAVSVSAFGRF